jgi:hypothetical protein
MESKHGARRRNDPNGEREMASITFGWATRKPWRCGITGN